MADWRTTHGMTGSRTYRAWACMKDRCKNRKTRCYSLYGGRGISVCRRWSESFEAFLEDMGECPGDMSLDRIDNNGNYEPGNCRWVSTAQQNRNTRRTRLITWNGETLCIADWSARTGIHRATIWLRLKNGWSIGDALTAKTQQGRAYRA